jgi:hypothetical protein
LSPASRYEVFKDPRTQIQHLQSAQTGITDIDLLFVNGYPIRLYDPKGRFFPE